MSETGDVREIERESIERDRDLAWELYDFQPEHPRIPELTQGVLAREPSFTGMIILLALHREACGEVAEARRLLQELMGRRDRQYVNAVKKLRDLEFSDERYEEALRLAEIVLRESGEVDWLDLMDHASALIFTGQREEGWRRIDAAVEHCARVDTGRYADALGQRAARLLASGAPPERFLPAAQEAVAADPSEPLLATTLGFAYLTDYRADDAEELFLRVLREDPTDSVAHIGLTLARAFLEPIRNGTHTMDDHRAAGSGEMAWRILRDQLFGTGIPEALSALDEVMPEDLRRSLRAPLDRDAARESGGDDTLLAWHDGQEPGAGAGAAAAAGSDAGAGAGSDAGAPSLWGTRERFRLMSAAEISAMDDAIEADPAAWPQWQAEVSYDTQLCTDDAGVYLIEGYAGRIYRRGPEGEDQEVAASLADWLWDRVATFGGADPRPDRG